MKTILSLFLFSSIFLVSCSEIRDSAGVNRKKLDEFKVIENPPLVIPPDFNLLPPEQLSEKNIANAAFISIPVLISVGRSEFSIF